MTALIAIAHIAGALIVQIALGVVSMMLLDWVGKRIQKATVEEACIELGIPLEEIDSAEHESKVTPFAAARFSSELFRNRVSDLCGWIYTGWIWLSLLLQVCVFLGVIWITLTERLENSVNAWWIVGIGFFFWITSVLFQLVCKLLTGRFPGESRQGRKSLAEAAQRRSVAMHDRGQP